MRIAIVGKGGAGKSVIAGTMARALAQRGRRVVVLDSDPMPGVAISAGLGPLSDSMLQDAAEQDDKGRWHLKKGIGPATAVKRFTAVGPDGVRVLQFGKASSGGLKPVTPSLNAFIETVHRLGRRGVLSDWDLIGDLPAGPRHAAYNWAPYARSFLVVVEPTWQSVFAARRVSRIAEQRRPDGTLLIANKIRDASDIDFVGDRLAPPFATIPEDEAVREADRRGEAIIDVVPSGPAVHAILSLLEKLLERSVGA